MPRRLSEEDVEAMEVEAERGADAEGSEAAEGAEIAAEEVVEGTPRGRGEIDYCSV